MPGFGYRLRAGAGGKVLRSWIVQYRRGGTTRRLLLGSAAVLTAEQARGLAKKALGSVAMGEDPAADRAERRGKDRLSFRSVVDEYLAYKQKQVRAKTYGEMRRYLTGGYFKPLHALPVDSISRKEIAARLVTIARESGDATSGLARAALSAFFLWATQSGITESNPVINTPTPSKAAERERALSDEELAASGAPAATMTTARSCGCSS